MLQLLPICAFAGSSVVNLSHYDQVHPNFVAMKQEGIVGVIHEATYPRYERDDKYYRRQIAATEAGLLWGAYHFGDGTNAVRQADHFLSVVRSSQTRTPFNLEDPSRPGPGVLLVLDFERNGHYPGGTMSVGQAAAFVERIKQRTGKYPGLYCSEYHLRQMLYGHGSTARYRRILSNCWLWIANYHHVPQNTAPWSDWWMWQYTGDGKCDLRPRHMFPKSIANIHKAERNIFRGTNVALRAFWHQHSWHPEG
jgi:lysozyme